MIPRSVLYTIALFLFLLLHPSPSQAHNGAVAIAVPVEGIAIDGDLSDWPAHVHWEHIELPSNFSMPLGPTDLTGRFAAGYAVASNTLYVALDVRDDEMALVDDGLWQDYFNLYLSWDHAAEGARVVDINHGAYVDSAAHEEGRRPGFAHGIFAVGQHPGGYRVEWRIDVPSGARTSDLRAGTAIGLNLRLGDRDGPHDRSQILWGDDQTLLTGASLGDLVLIDADNSGSISISTRWEDPSAPLPRAVVELVPASGSGSLRIRMDDDGTSDLVLPQDRYAAHLIWPGEGTVTSEVEVQTGTSTSLYLDLLLRPKQGLRAGEGRGHWQDLSVTDGLAALAVYSLLQDRQGRLWIGQEGGVSRYDGRRLQTWTWAGEIPRGEGDGLNWVNDMHQDRDGRIWIATYQGIYHFDNTRFQALDLADSLGIRYDAIAEDGAGNLWFGAGGIQAASKLLRWDGHEITAMSDSVQGARGLLYDVAGHLWGAGNDHVWRYDGQKFSRYEVANPRTLYEDHEGAIWAGAGQSRAPFGEVYRFDGEQFTLEISADRLPVGPIAAIAQDPEGVFWFGSQGNTLSDGLGGVSRYDGQQLRTYRTTDGLAFDGVSAILEDREGNLWFGTGYFAQGGGVSRHETERIRTFTVEDGLPTDLLKSLAQDQEGHLWMGSDLGVTRFSQGTFDHFDVADGLFIPEGGPQLLVEHQGAIWFGGQWYREISRFDGQFWTTHRARVGQDLAALGIDPAADEGAQLLWVLSRGHDDFPGGQTRRIIRDREENLWIGSFFDGAFRVGNGEPLILTVGSGLRDEHVNDLFVDRNGRVWIATGYGGVARYDDSSTVSYTVADGLGANWVNDIAETSDGLMAFATSGGGLSLYDGRVFQTLTEADGLGHNTVWDVLADRGGDLWMATSGGLTRYRRGNTPPLVHIEEVVADRSYGPAETVSLTTEQDIVTFRFAATHFGTRPGQMAYLYRIDGIDEDWRMTREEQAVYEDLPAGRRRFEVRAVSGDLIYSEPATVRLVVHPPYGDMALWSSVGLALALVVLQGARIVRRDRRLVVANRQIEETTRNKSEFLRRMSHDLRSPMNAIIGYTRLLRRRLADRIDEREARNLANIETSSGNLLNLINDILDLSRIEAGRTEIVVQPVGVGALAGECADALGSIVEEGVELRRELTDVGEIKTDPDRLRQVVMNLLGNAMKFTDAGSITLSLRSVGGVAELAVADTGVGIPPEDLPHIFDEFRQVERQGGEHTEGTGLGLAIAKKTVDLLGGTLTAESEVGVGTTFTLRISDYES